MTFNEIMDELLANNSVPFSLKDAIEEERARFGSLMYMDGFNEGYDRGYEDGAQS